MKKSILILACIFIASGIFSQPGKKIIILHTNDLHSHLVGFAPESDYSPLSINNDSTVGGFARISAIIKAEKEENSESTMVLDAGDFLMGTLFHSVEVNTGFQLRLMKTMGYDVTCFGNHEFDFGLEKLAELINNSERQGEIPALLAGNWVFDKKDNRDDSLEKLFDEKIIKRKITLIRNGVKIGLFSLLGQDAVSDSPSAAPLTFSKQISYAKKMAKELRNDSCNIVICLSHSGVKKDKEGKWAGEDVELAQKVHGIDVIISGHSHTRLDSPIVVNGIPIVQTGVNGQFVGRLALDYTGGKVSVDSYSLIPVDDRIMGDKNVEHLIEIQKDKITSEILEPIGMKYNTPVAESGFKLEGNETGNYKESNLGPLVADALRYYINKHSSKGTDMSMVATGLIRDMIRGGIEETSDIFRVMSLGSGNDNVPGYPLSRIYVTGKELKSILEILQIAYKSKPDNYCYYSGITVEYNPEKGLFRKIKKIEINSDHTKPVNVDFSRKNKSLYSVSGDSYMLSFIGIIKKMSFGLINVVPKDENGNKVNDMRSCVIDIDENHDGIQEGKEWLALVEFLGSMKDTNGNGIPDIDKKYEVPVKCFFQGSSR